MVYVTVPPLFSINHYFFSVAKLQDECGERVKVIYVFTGSNCVDKENC